MGLQRRVRSRPGNGHRGHGLHRALAFQPDRIAAGGLGHRSGVAVRAGPRVGLLAYPVQERVEDTLADRRAARPGGLLQRLQRQRRLPCGRAVAARLGLQQIDGELTRPAVPGQLLGPRPDFVVESPVRRALQPQRCLAHHRERGPQLARRVRLRRRVRRRTGLPERGQKRLQVRRLVTAQYGRRTVPGQRTQRLPGPRVAARQIVDRRLPGLLRQVTLRVPGEVGRGEQRDAGRGRLLHRVGEQRRRAHRDRGVPAGVRAEEDTVLRVVVDRVVVHRDERMPERGACTGQFPSGDGPRYDADPCPGDLHPVVQLLGERGPVVRGPVLVELRRHHRQRLRARMPLREMPGDLTGDPGLSPRRRLRAAAERGGVVAAVPFAVADVLELELEDAHAQRPHRVDLPGQRLHVAVGGHAHGLAGGDRPAEGHVPGAGPFGQCPEVGAPLGGVRIAPAGLPVRVVARRVEVPVLLRAPHEVDLREPLLARPRLPVEPLGHSAYGGARPVPHGDPGDAPVPDQLAQRLHGVEQAVVADTVQGDGGAARDRADRDPVAAGRQIGALGGAQRAQGVLRTVAAEPDDRPAPRQYLVHGPHARVAQHLPGGVDGVRIGVRAGDEGHLGGERYGRPGRLDGLWPRPHGGQRALVGTVGCGDGGGAGVRRRGEGGRGPGGEQSAEHGDRDGRRVLSVPEPHAVLPRSHRWAPSPPPHARGCQCVWPLCRICPLWRMGRGVGGERRAAAEMASNGRIRRTTCG